MVAATPPQSLEVLGRESELTQVQRALAERGPGAVSLIGVAGIGKSMIASAAFARAVSSGAIGGHGQHRFGVDGDDLNPLITALEQAVSAGLDQLHDPQSGFELLAAALGDNAALIAHEGPGAFAMFDAALSAREQNTAGVERMFAAVSTILRWLVGFNQTIVLFIDDWGRAQGRAAEFYRRMLSMQGLDRVHILATERTDEPFAHDAHVERIVVGRLPRSAENELVSQLSGLNAVECDALLQTAADAYETPLELARALRTLIANDGITEDAHGRRRFDRHTLLRSFGASGCAQLLNDCEALAPGAIRVAQCAAILGAFAHLVELERISGLDEGAFNRARIALTNAGVMKPDRQTLSHDTFVQAALAALSGDQRAELSSRIAAECRAVGTRGSDGQRGQLMLDCLLQSHSPMLQSWNNDLVDGAALARATGDVKRFVRFAEAALSTVDDEIAAPFAMLREGVFAALESGEHARAVKRAELLVTKASLPSEKALADELLVNAYLAGGEQSAALLMAKRSLEQHGVAVPERVRLGHVLAEVIRIGVRDPKKAAEQPALTDEELARYGPLMRSLAVLGPILYEKNPALAFVTGSRALSDRVVAGTAVGAAAQAVLCSEAGLYERAVRWGELSEARQGRRQPLRSLAAHFAASYGHYYAPSGREIGRGRSVAEMAFAEGDLSTAAVSLRYEAWDAFNGETPLSEALSIGEANRDRLAFMRDEAGVRRTAGGLEIMRRLMDGGAEAWRLDMTAAAFDAEVNAAARGLAGYEAILGAAYGADEYVVALYDRWQSAFARAPFHTQTLKWTFLTGLALYRSDRRPHWIARFALRRAARVNPRRFAHRVTLFRAEEARQRGQSQAALQHYVEAVEQARRAECFLELGITAEAACYGSRFLGFKDPSLRFQETAGETWRRFEAFGVLRARGHVAAVSHAEAEREAAMRTSKARSRFLALVGHELRTPLQGLSGLLEVAAATDEKPDIRSLQAAVQHLRRVVSDLVDLAAADGGALSINAAPMSVSEAMDSLAAVLRQAPECLGLSVRVHAPNDLCVLADAARIRQVLTNLVFNAWAHARSACEIEVTASDMEDDGVSLTFRVMDRGAGVPIEKLARLLEPFQRGEESTGLGLGLAVSHNLAKAMGGTFGVADRDGGGAVFSLMLNVPRAKAEAHAKKATPAAIRSVLVVEDDDLSRDVVAALIRLDGAKVGEAKGYHDALGALQKEAFDAILIDRSLGDGDGLDLLRTLRASSPDAKCIIVSASVPEELRREAMAVGASAVLEKPVTRAMLSEVLSVQAADKPHASRVEELRAALKDEADRLLAAVGPNVERSLERIENAAGRDDWADVRREAHRLRGLAVNFGFDDLAAAARAVEFGEAEVSALRAAAAASVFAPPD